MLTLVRFNLISLEPSIQIMFMKKERKREKEIAPTAPPRATPSFISSGVTSVLQTWHYKDNQDWSPFFFISKQSIFVTPSLHRCSRESPDFHPLLENTALGAWQCHRKNHHNAVEQVICIVL